MQKVRLATLGPLCGIQRRAVVGQHHNFSIVFYLVRHLYVWFTFSAPNPQVVQRTLDSSRAFRLKNPSHIDAIHESILKALALETFIARWFWECGSWCSRSFLATGMRVGSSVLHPWPLSSAQPFQLFISSTLFLSTISTDTNHSHFASLRTKYALLFERHV